LYALAVNRVIHVQSNGKTYQSVVVMASRTTATFGAAGRSATGLSRANGRLIIPRRYDQLFPDVVGTVGPDGINEIIMTGAAALRKLFFTYTDNSFAPDYSIFIALKLFTLK